MAEINVIYIKLKIFFFKIESIINGLIDKAIYKFILLYIYTNMALFVTPN